MPPKIQKMIDRLLNAEFNNRGGKGSHRNFSHVKGAKITIGGKSGEDAKPYQVKAVKKALDEVLK